ncbi:threonine aldolase family protein [Kineosporia babensis]|uniref:Beta-eliminating lyase-related protein n=1 Tax=Kineosporia babensis TaxID=499548 RepID=A0A9X1ST72_9ACTN|nr:GntG family PLP-dependent aldolase [Kineosporia babensis]MCD5311514.1 beta-eliminating lyase-related protein [Kineosporia babensis]
MSPAGSPVVDLRSDTLTRPTPGMLEAMVTAEVGDDVYGEDPEINALEAEVAALFGHEAALFCPTGSMSNVLGVRSLVPAGQEIICDSLAHIVRAELGSHAMVGQVTTRTWSSERGAVEADAALAMAVPDAGPYFVSTAAIAIEDTHNFGGGTVQAPDELRRLRAGAQALGLSVHLDGARLWNAHVVTGVSFQEYGSFADTISVCLSKGLGAPVGSVLVSSAERIAEARIWRKRLGGGMRQAGVLAAAGRYALKHNIERLATDHQHAQSIAVALAGVDSSIVEPELVQTNIVATTWPSAAAAKAFIAGCTAAGIRVGAVGSRVVRLVTHLDIDEALAGRAVDELPVIAKQALTA